jgi:hypothetical protein
VVEVLFKYHPLVVSHPVQAVAVPDKQFLSVKAVQVPCVVFVDFVQK